MNLNRTRRWGRRAALAFAAASVGTVFISCPADTWATFAGAASSGIGDGLKVAFSGLVDGVVAVVNSSSQTSDSNSSSSGNST